jgi:bacteriocin biosynthesis cyclodehydratase domain-containing protein
MQEVFENPTYRLNSLVTWHDVEGDRLQVRFPDGDHITFDADGKAISKILNSLSSGVIATDDSLFAAIFDLLGERKLVIKTMRRDRDWMEDALDYILRLAEDQPQSAPLDLVYGARMDIRGTGWLAELTREACEIVGIQTIDSHSSEEGPSLVVAVADSVSYDWFSEVNAETVAKGVSAVFMWREVGRIVAGPLVLPRLSACFECYRWRVRMNMKFGAEFDAHARVQPSNFKAIGSELANGSARTFIGRQLLLIAARAYDIVQPGAVHSYDLLTLEHGRQPVLKAPRCRVCSSSPLSPKRSVRAIS